MQRPVRWMSGCALAVLSVMSSSVMAQTSLCEPGEQVLFSCTIGAKVASVCKNTAQDVQYRFGKPGRRAELLYPQAPGKPADNFFWDSQGYAKGGYEYVTFKNADHVYIIYNVQKAFSEEEGDTGMGVFVLEDDVLRANLHCKEPRPPTFLADKFKRLGLQPSPFGQPPRVTDKPLELPLFQGEWEAWSCPDGGDPSPERCSHFGVSLHESQGKLCGMHSFVTAGAARMNEGSPPSLLGPISGRTANLTVKGARSATGVTLDVQLTRDQDSLVWKVPAESPDEELLPRTSWLRRSLRPVFSPEAAAELRAACGVTATKQP